MKKPFLLSLFVACLCLMPRCATPLESLPYIRIPSELHGTWVTDSIPITVRTSPSFMKFEFHKGGGTIVLQIGDSSASGSIGMARFDNVPLVKNSGNPDRTGVAYMVECGYIGKIFDADPVERKRVAIWIGPLKNGEMDSELRYTEGGAQFPMAGFVLRQ